MYKNWQEICRVKDELLRLLVATTNDAYILAGLEKGFPELFCAEASELRVPASALRERARAYSRREWNDSYIEFDVELDWYHVLDEFNIPTALAWGYDMGRVPRELLEQLVGQRFEAGLTIIYKGVRCLVVSIDDHAGRLHEVIEIAPETEYLILAPADCFDLNS